MASAVVGVAVPAHAASGDAGYVAAGSNIRSGPSTDNSILYTSSYGANIPLQCYTDTQSSADNGAWRRWFKYNQAEEWVWADNVSNQPSLPHC